MSVPIFQGVDGARLHSVVHANFTTSCRQVGGVLQSWLLSRSKRKEAFGAAAQFDQRKHPCALALLGCSPWGTVLQQLQTSDTFKD
jgi:hypothetical protein